MSTGTARIPRRRIGAMLFTLVLVLSSCLPAGCKKQTPASAESAEERTVLHVAIAQEAASYAGAQYLLNEDTRAKLEDQLNVTIKADVLSDLESIGDLGALSFSDVLLCDDPMWIVPLAERGQLLTLRNQDFLLEGDIAECGRYGGHQYAYPLTKDWHRPTRTMLLVLPEALDSAGIHDIPYTAEAFWDALETLTASFRVLPKGRPARELVDVYSGSYRTPLIVYGLPTDGGCSVLLGLYGLAPTGGREFQLSGTQVVLDKTTEAGRAYLTYISTLHQEGHIPYDFLSLTVYNAIMQFGCGLSPMAMIDEAHVAAAIDYAEQNGLHAAVAELPLPDAALEENIYHRLMGMVSSGSHNQTLAEALLCCLFEQTGDSESAAAAPIAYDTYPLFENAAPERPSIYDPVERCSFDARLHYTKYSEDEVIKRYYARIAVNNLDISAFDDMLQQWYCDSDDNSAVVETIADRFTRKYLLQFSLSGSAPDSGKDEP